MNKSWFVRVQLQLIIGIIKETHVRVLKVTHLSLTYENKDNVRIHSSFICGEISRAQ